MGIVNVTPDSFSDGGLYAGQHNAIAHGMELLDQGADILDVGGESTRPGADPVEAEEELARVLPVITALVNHGAVVSVDTMKAEVAAAAISAGVHIVNDITSLRDPGMAEVCADGGVGVVLMHMQGTPQTMQIHPHYKDVVAEVRDYLETRATFCIDSGVDPDRIVIDPGIGFGKEFEHNIELISSTSRLAESKYPLLIGTSRKGFLGEILRVAGFDTVGSERDAATAATVAMAVAGGAAIVRVHNVSHGLQAARTADAMVRSPSGRYR